MNTRFLLLALSVAVLSSCTSMYKSGQTPDDVYYSPARPAPDEYVETEQRSNDNYQTYDEYADSYRNDRFLRMSVRNRYRMNSFDEMDWYNMRYGNIYSYNYMGYNSWSLNNPWNSYYAWNNYYNPYCGNRGNYYGGNNWKNTANYRQPSVRSYTFNSSSYKSNNRPARTGNTYYNNGSRYNNSNSNGLGGSLNKIFNNSGSNNNSSPSNNTYTPTRSYNPSPSSSGSSGGSSGGGNSSGNNSGSGTKRPGGGR